MKNNIKSNLISVAAIGAIGLVPGISFIQLESEQPKIISNSLGDDFYKVIMPPLIVHDATATYPST